MTDPRTRTCKFCGKSFESNVTPSGLEEGTIHFVLPDGSFSEPLYFCFGCEEKVKESGERLAKSQNVDFKYWKGNDPIV